MGVLKIRGKWGIEWYGEDGKRKRKVIQDPDKPTPAGGWFEVAKKAYRDTKTRLDKGEPVLFATSKKPFAQMAETYWETCKGTWSPVEAARVRSMLDNHILPFFGTMKLARVKRIHIDEYVAQRQREGTAPAGINKERARLHHFFAKCIEWEELSRNPCSGVKKLTEPDGVVAYLDGDERVRLLEACSVRSGTLHDIVVFAMLTGARLSEILNLRWENVDLRRRIITLRKTKSKKTRHIPVNPDLLGLLRRLEPAADSTAPLFPPVWNGRRVSTAFRRVASGWKRRNGTWVPGVKPGFRFHDLRHDFASWLTMGGVHIRGVQTLLGHADLRMTERYSHMADRVLAAAVEVLPALPGNGNGHGVVEHTITPPVEIIPLPTA